MTRFQMATIIVVATILILATVVMMTEPEQTELTTEQQVALWTKQANDAIAKPDIAAAKQLYTRVLQAEPDNGQALLVLGQIARDEGDRELASKLWRRVPDHGSLPAEAPKRRQGGTARYLEATLHLEDHDLADGEKGLLRSVALNPTYVLPRDRLVQLYVAQMRIIDVRRQLQGIRMLRPWTINELVLHESIAAGVTDAKKGQELVASAVAANPDDLPSHIALGRYYLFDSRHKAAEQLFRSTLKRRPRHADAAGLLADALMNQLEFEEAGEVLGSQELDLQAAGEHYWRSLGRFATEQTDWKTAEQAYRRLLDVMPNDLAAQNRYAASLQRLGRRDEADKWNQLAALGDFMRRQASRVLHGKKDSKLRLPIVQSVARTMAKLNRREEALWWFEQAQTMNSNVETQADVRIALSTVQREGPGRTIPSVAGEKLAAMQQASRVASQQSATKQHGPSIGPADSTSEPNQPNANSSIQTRVSLKKRNHLPAKPPSRSRLALRDVAEEVGVRFSYFNGQSGLKYLVESMGGGVAVLDYDMDGFPDLYLAQGCPLPAKDANREHTDRLFRNLGDGQFVDVTEAAGLGDHQYGQGCTSADFDNDGDPDIFVNNFGRNVFYRNNGDGTFEDITDETGLGGEQWSSAVTLADFDRDGLLDLYLTNYVDSLRVCHAEDGRAATCDPHNFGAEQDRLYWNRGDGRFTDITKQSGIVAPDGKGLGTLVADYDNDGWLDIYIANDGEPNFLFQNLAKTGSPQFKRQGRDAGVSVSDRGEAEAGMGLACADFNYDGLFDIYVTNFHGESNTMYLNLGDMLFRDATKSTGLSDPTLPLLGFGAQAIDLDLDGRWELFVANGHIDDLRHRGDPWKMQAQLFRESGRGRYRDVSDEAGAYFNNQRLGRGVVKWDWNRDNDTDLLIVHQQDAVALLDNECPEKGNALVLELVGVQSNRDAVGTRIEVLDGASKRVYTISAGDGFFSHSERRLLLGIDKRRNADIRIRWPNGQWSEFKNLAANQLHTLIEQAD